MVLSTLQTISIMVGIIYYLGILRNTQKTRELTLKAQEQVLETRKLQLFIQQYQKVTSVEFQKISNELLEWEWDSFDDFSEKYVSDPKVFAEWVIYMLNHDSRGILLKEGFVDSHMLYLMDQGGMGPTKQWVLFKPIVEELRNQWNNQLLFTGYEYYVDEMMKIRKKEGLSSKWSPNLNKFIEE